MKLFSKIYGDKEQDLIIIHGLFGMGDNWRTLGKQFSKYCKVHLIDLRNHGKSPHAEKFNYEVIYFYNVYGPYQITKGEMATVIGIFEDHYNAQILGQFLVQNSELAPVSQVRGLAIPASFLADHIQCSVQRVFHQNH